jgi:uncharacterized lipoprotein YajG
MKWFFAACAVFLLAGCGIKHQAIHPTLPTAHVNPVDGRPIVIQAVTDSRTPLDDLALTPSERPRNVGGVGRGGNCTAVDLDEGTVASLGRQMATQALRTMGYKVVPDAAADVPRIEIDITRFSVAMPFKFLRAISYSQQMVADISTNVTVRNGTSVQSFEATGHGTNAFQVVKPENWEVAINRAIEDFSKRFQEKMLTVE